MFVYALAPNPSSPQMGSTTPPSSNAEFGRPWSSGGYSYGEACLLGGKNYFVSGGPLPKPFGTKQVTDKNKPTSSSFTGSALMDTTQSSSGP
jgi:hypothetical protein